LAKRRRDTRHARRHTVAVRGPSRPGTVRPGVRGQVHGRSGPKANGILHGPRGRELAVPDGRQSAGREQRSQLLGHRPPGGGHRDAGGQVEERENGGDEAVRGRRQPQRGGRRHDERVLRRHGGPVQRPGLDRVERVGRPAGRGGGRRHSGVRGRQQRPCDGRRRRRGHARRPGRLAGGRPGPAGHVHGPRVRFLQARPGLRVPGGGRQAVRPVLSERPGPVLRVVPEQVRPAGRRGPRPRRVRFVRVSRAVLQTGAQSSGPVVR